MADEKEDIYALLGIAKEQQKIAGQQQKQIDELMNQLPEALRETLQDAMEQQSTQHRQNMEDTRQQFDTSMHRLRLRLILLALLPTVVLCLLAIGGTLLYINQQMQKVPAIQQTIAKLEKELEGLREDEKLINPERLQWARCRRDNGHEGRCIRTMASWGGHGDHADYYFPDYKD